MAFLQTTFIWIAYAVAVGLLIVVASIFVYMYQTPRDRSAAVSTICIITLTSLLATVMLMPVDIALVSSTTSSRLGHRKDWATQEEVDRIVNTLKIVYYLLYSLDALLCLVVVPFTYFWYEEYDDVAAEEGNQTFGERFWGAFKYTIAFILLCVLLFLVGFFVPVAKDKKNRHVDLDYFKRLLAENHGERALTFALGLLIVIGTLLYVIYTAVGFALLPVTFIKSAPAISAPDLAATTASELEINREEQRALDGRAAGRPDGLSNQDQRRMDQLVREERTLVRRERLAAEARGEGKTWVVRMWHKTEAIFRPLKLIGGMILLLVSLIVWVSMLITGIDKARNSICGVHCGYILGDINVFQPVNFMFVKSAKVFPVDYILFALLVLYFFTSSVVGIARVGIRFLWVRLFSIKKGRTAPQAMLMATVMLTLMTLAINYSLSMMVAPQYATFGPQTFCTQPPKHPGEQPDCSDRPDLIKACSELLDDAAAKDVCTPSVVSTFLNRITFNFPFFGIVLFWAQFFFLAMFLLIFTLSLFRVPGLKDEDDDDEDLIEDEEEGLLASTGRRFGATWGDITGHARGAKKQKSYGTAGRNIRNDEGAGDGGDD